MKYAECRLFENAKSKNEINEKLDVFTGMHIIAYPVTAEVYNVINWLFCNQLRKSSR